MMPALIGVGLALLAVYPLSLLALAVMLWRERRAVDRQITAAGRALVAEIERELAR